MKYFASLTAVCLLLTGCSHEIEDMASYSYAEKNVDIKESKTSHFFAVDSNFQMSDEGKAKLSQLLKDSKGRGIENVGFIIVSDSPVAKTERTVLSNQVRSQMEKAGFLDSRIIDSGICVYKDAKKGVRVDILKYDLKRSTFDEWDDPIGDCDLEQNLPNWSKATNYNMEEMIANPADLISPRKYKGQKATDAISAISSAGK